MAAQKLQGEPQPATTICAAAERDGVFERDLKRAKGALGVLAGPLGFAGAWHWSLPRAQ